MKKLLIVFILSLVFNAAMAQANFKIEDGKVIWQKVYELSDSVNVRDKLIEKNILTDIIETNQKLIGQIKPMKIDFKRQGFSRMNIPIYISNSDFTGNVSIESKGKKYRITLSNIILIDNITAGILKEGNKTDYELYALNRKKEFRDMFLKFDAIIVENDFSKLFSIDQTKSDW